MMTTRQALVRDYIRQELARIMGVEPESLETDQPLSTFGLDSLLALELKNNLESRLDFTLPMAKLMEGPRIASLAEETVRLVVGERLQRAGSDSVRMARSLKRARRTKLGRRWWRCGRAAARPPLVLLPALGGDVALLCRAGAATGRRSAGLCVPSARHRPGPAAAPDDGRNDRRLRGGAPRAAADGPVSSGRLVDGRHLRVRAGRGAGASRRRSGAGGAVRYAAAVDLRRRRCRG